MKRILSLLTVLAAGALVAPAQTSLEEIRENPDRAGGVYLAYPNIDGAPVTPAPKGYEPFYISHFSRHGSRYLISDTDYSRLIEKMEAAKQAGALTDVGLDMLDRLNKVWLEAEGRGGELTPLGHRQHRAIGRRMIEHYPQVFAGEPRIFARSTVVMRCAHSMNSFCEGLKEVRPTLHIDRESSQRHMSHLNYHTDEANHFTRRDGPWAETSRKFEQEQTRPERLMKLIFNDPSYVYANINPHDFMWSVYWVTVDMQNMESPVRFNDILTPEELFDMWQAFNWRFYATNSNNPMADGLLLDCARPSLKNIMECARKAIKEGYNGADLRFAHDGNIIPLAGLMQLDNCYGQESRPGELYKVYSDFKISPMAANIQMVFFRNKKNPEDILVKFLLNEEETRIPIATDRFPFYAWRDVEAFYDGILDKATASRPALAEMD